GLTPLYTQALFRQNYPQQLPKSLYFDPAKTKWEAFYLKFNNYAREKNWSSDECKSNLMYVLEGKAAEFFASLHEREPTLPFFDIIRRLESRFGYRELQETSNLAFMNSTQNKGEKLEEWADRVLTLATRAFRGLPDEHIQKQAVLRFCHGCYDRNAGLHAANKMLSRMEEAIDCVKWYQYNHQIFTDCQKDRKTVQMVQYETPGYECDGCQIWSPALQAIQPSSTPGEPRYQKQERYVTFRGPKTENKSASAVSTSFSSTDQVKLEKVQCDLEERVTRFEEKMDGRMARIEQTLQSLAEMMVAKPKSVSPEKKTEIHNKEQMSQQLEENEDLNNSGSDLKA
ncbi:MAG: hypothetical protein AB2693_05050, partial [Candidatus Thiodiazotropha sp.]